jgi:Sulfotransferase family
LGSTGLNAGLARLFGLRLVSDITERLCDIGARPILNAKRQDRLEKIRKAGVLFVHVPKNAGMSISEMLYGCQVKHASVRYYARVAPDLLRDLDSIAVIRDPVDRFLSAYDYARAGGSADNRVSAPFYEIYKAFRSVEDALDHVERAASLYHVDHIFRPQTWYLADAAGAIRVRRLVRFEQVGELSSQFSSGRPVPSINRRSKPVTHVTPQQMQRIRRVYASDVALLNGYSLRTEAATPCTTASVMEAAPLQG